MDLSDPDLRAIIKSLSITSDSLAGRVERLRTDRRRAEALAEYQHVDDLLGRARQEMSTRLQQTERETT